MAPSKTFPVFLLCVLWSVIVHSFKIPVKSQIHGDLCRKLDGKRYYLNAGTTAVIYVDKLTYPTQDISRRNVVPHAPFHRLKRSKESEASSWLSSPIIGSREVPPWRFIRNALQIPSGKRRKERTGGKPVPTKKVFLPSNRGAASAFSGALLGLSRDNVFPQPRESRELRNSLIPHFSSIGTEIPTLQADQPVLSKSDEAEEVPKNGSVSENEGASSVAPQSSELPTSTSSDTHVESLEKIKNTLTFATTTIPTTTTVLTPPLNTVKNVIKQIKKDSTYFSSERGQGGDIVSGPNPRQLRCGMELTTCPECHLQVVIHRVMLTSCSHDKSCRCDYIRLREPPYLNEGGRDICTEDVSIHPYLTQTREATIDFFYSHSYREAFLISVAAERNVYRIRGEPGVTVDTISTPFYPELYPKDYWAEYILEGSDTNSRIKLTFLDFQISPWSFVEIEDTNKSRIATFNGNIFRPQVLVSSGHEVKVRFSANGETARGFRLRYDFVTNEPSEVKTPITDCGGYVTNFGGVITMMNMTSSNTSEVSFDCIWLIQPPQDYVFKSHISIKVVQFEKMGEGTSLEIRQGTTSEDYLLEKLTSESSLDITSQEHVVAIDSGFYVRLEGTFAKDSKLAILYTSFSYIGNCYALTDLLCRNHRCIPKMLRCDGFNHCGDSSDEPESCYRGKKSLTPHDAVWWYENTPNYYFPQKNSIFGAPTNGSGILLLFSLFALLLILIGLLSFMFRQNVGTVISHQNRERRNQAMTSFNDGVEIFDASADDPPVYEPPPDYEEVVKLILSGNNLKLVRRPGGRTAWVPDDPPKESEEGTDPGGGQKPEERRLSVAELFGEDAPRPLRPTRTRHASLDFEKDSEVILWQPKSVCNSRRTSMCKELDEGQGKDLISFSSPGHVRRSSLPVTPLPSECAPKHVVSIPLQSSDEACCSTSLHVTHQESPKILECEIQTGTITGPTRKSMRKSQRKSSSNKRKGHKKGMKYQEAQLPPSYEMVLLQKNENTDSPTVQVTISRTDSHSGVKASHFRRGVHKRNSAVLRVRAAREKFQKLSRGETVILNEGLDAREKRSSQRLKRGKRSCELISVGTVKERRAELMKSLLQDCSCNGACTCALIKPLNNDKKELINSGIVKSKINYYIALQSGLLKDSTDSGSQMLIENDFTVANSSGLMVDSKNQNLCTSELPLTSGNSNSYQSLLDKKCLLRNHSAPSLGEGIGKENNMYTLLNNSSESTYDFCCYGSNANIASPEHDSIENTTASDAYNNNNNNPSNDDNNNSTDNINEVANNTETAENLLKESFSINSSLENDLFSFGSFGFQGHLAASGTSITTTSTELDLNNEGLDQLLDNTGTSFKDATMEVGFPNPFKDVPQSEIEKNEIVVKKKEEKEGDQTPSENIYPHITTLPSTGAVPKKYNSKLMSKKAKKKAARAATCEYSSEDERIFD